MSDVVIVPRLSPEGMNRKESNQVITVLKVARKAKKLPPMRVSHQAIVGFPGKFPVYVNFTYTTIPAGIVALRKVLGAVFGSRLVVRRYHRGD